MKKIKLWHFICVFVVFCASISGAEEQEGRPRIKSVDQIKESGFERVIESVQMKSGDSATKNVYFLGVITQDYCVDTNDSRCPKDEFYWSVSPWSECSNLTNTINRTATCRKSVDDSSVDDTNCVGAKPTEEMHVNCESSEGEGEKAYDWIEAGTTSCEYVDGAPLKCSSYSCASRAERKVVEDSFCESPRPESICVPCVIPVGLYSWVTGDWSESEDDVCTRSIACVDDNMNYVDDNNCDPSTKPSTDMSCPISGEYDWEEVVHICEPVAGKPGIYSYFRYECKDVVTGSMVTASNCVIDSEGNPNPAPETIYIPCETKNPPKIDGDWRTSNWGDCVVLNEAELVDLDSISGNEGEGEGEWSEGEGEGEGEWSEGEGEGEGEGGDEYGGYDTPPTNMAFPGKALRQVLCVDPQTSEETDATNCNESIKPSESMDCYVKVDGCIYWITAW